MAGTLYLVATPIGNLGDITLRALEVLKSADLIACEDTRTSGKLLKHYEIETPVTSYHKFNEQEKSASLVSSLLAGKDIALITDAGMFLAIIVPPTRKNRVIAFLIPICFISSFLMARLPVVSGISAGTRTIILTVVIAGIAALFFPVKEDAFEETPEKEAGNDS